MQHVFDTIRWHSLFHYFLKNTQSNIKPWKYETEHRHSINFQYFDLISYLPCTKKVNKQKRRRKLAYSYTIFWIIGMKYHRSIISTSKNRKIKNKRNCTSCVYILYIMAIFCSYHHGWSLQGYSIMVYILFQISYN